MSTLEMRKFVREVAESLPAKKLASLVDYAEYLGRQPKKLTAEDKRKIGSMRRSIARAEREYAEGRTVNWRTVRRDV